MTTAQADAPARVRPVTETDDEDLIMVDLFCGAGGTTTGAAMAAEELGRNVRLKAINHWPVAVATHRLNHPEAEHYVQDLDGADPEAIVPEGRVDVLLASPECRHFSRARGGKPINDQARMNPWVIQRWLTSLNVKILVAENVPEFRSWGPLLSDGRPDKRRKGLYFEEWVRSMWGLGYTVEWKLLNAADYGEATTRVRFFLQARNDGLPITWPEPSHAPSNEPSLLGLLPRWRGAKEIIDWSDPGRSLIDDPKYKKRPLSVNTRKRIARGLVRFGGPLAALYIQLLNLPDDALAELPEPQTEQPTRAFHGSNRQNTAPRDMDQPVLTITTWTNGGCYLAWPTARLMNNPGARPFLLGQQSGGAPRDADEPIPTITGDGAISVIRPMIAEYYGKGETKSVDDPLSTITTKGRHGLASPVLIDAGVRGERNQTPVPNPRACIVPNFGERSGQKPRVHDIAEPTPTITSRGAGSIVSPTLASAEQSDLAGADPGRLIVIEGKPYLLDIRYRMLNNQELARAMGFSDKQTRYEFVGNATEITRQIGNAVPVRLAAALVRAALSAPQSGA